MTDDDAAEKRRRPNTASEQVDEDYKMEFPLFMIDLPANFSENAALSALGSLLDDDDGGAPTDEHQQNYQGNESDDTPQEKIQSIERPNDSGMDVSFRRDVNPGGGKFRRAKTREERRRANEPYNLAPPTNKAKPPPSVGESTLYLKLWKL